MNEYNKDIETLNDHLETKLNEAHVEIDTSQKENKELKEFKGRYYDLLLDIYLDARKDKDKMVGSNELIINHISCNEAYDFQLDSLFGIDFLGKEAIEYLSAIKYHIKTNDKYNIKAYEFIISALEKEFNNDED